MKTTRCQAGKSPCLGDTQMLGFSMVMGKFSGMDSLRNPTDIERLITVKGIVIRCSDLTPEAWTSKKNLWPRDFGAFCVECWKMICVCFVLFPCSLFAFMLLLWSFKDFFLHIQQLDDMFHSKRKRTGYGMSTLVTSIMKICEFAIGLDSWRWTSHWDMDFDISYSWIIIQVKFIHLQTFANISATFRKGHECSTFSMHHGRLQERGEPKKGEPGIRLVMAIWSLVSII